MEKSLRRDVHRELFLGKGRVLLHTSSKTHWSIHHYATSGSSKPEDIMTPRVSFLSWVSGNSLVYRNVFELIAREGYKVIMHGCYRTYGLSAPLPAILNTFPYVERMNRHLFQTVCAVGPDLSDLVVACSLTHLYSDPDRVKRRLAVAGDLVSIVKWAVGRTTTGMVLCGSRCTVL